MTSSSRRRGGEFRRALAASMLVMLATTVTSIVRAPLVDALPNGASCGASPKYQWTTQPQGSTPSAFTLSGVTVTPSLTTSLPAGSEYFITSEQRGAETGIIRMLLDGTPNGQLIGWRLTFSEPVYDFTIPFLDIDSVSGTFTDVVQFSAFSGGTNVTNTATAALGSSVAQTGVNPLEFTGIANVPSESTAGNAVVTVPGPITRIDVTYIDGPGPDQQVLGIGDVGFCAPQTGLAKRVVSGPTSNGNGTHSATYRFVLKNLGGTGLYDNQITDSLTGAFGTRVVGTPTIPGQYQTGPPVIVTNAASPLAVNSSFNGSSNTGLLDPAIGHLAVGESIVVDLPVTFYPTFVGATFTANNTATAAGDTLLNRNGVTSGNTNDVSDNGADPDPNSNGNPSQAGENDPTPFTVTATRSISLDKQYTGFVDTDGSGTRSVGDRYNYSFLVRNTGDVTLTSVGVTDPTAGPVTCPVNTLAAGASTTCTSFRTLTQANIDAGVVNNTATASGTQGGITVTAVDSESTPVAQISSISIVKSFTGSTTGLVAGSVMTYNAVVTNTGTVTLTSIAVNDPIAASVTCPGTSLASRATMTCAITYLVTQADVDRGQIDNVASVAGTDPNGAVRVDNDAERVILNQTPSIDINKPAPVRTDNDSSGTTSLGDVLTYNIVVTNTGNVTLNSVAVTDSITGPVTCTPTSLAPGAIANCVTSLTVNQAQVDAGMISNTATVTANSVSGGAVSDTDSENTPVPRNSSISLDKVFTSLTDTDGSGTTTAGDIANYFFIVRNGGNTTLTGVAVSDPLTGPVDCGGVTALAPGASVTCSGSYVITQADVDAGVFVNTATVAATGPGGSTVQDSDTETITPTQQPSVDVAKSLASSNDLDSSGDISVNDELNYSIVVTNTGTVTLSNIVVDDSLTGSVTCPVSTLVPGDSTTCLTTYVVVQGDVDAGMVDNVATVTAEDPDGDPLTDTDDESVTVPQTSGLSLAKSLGTYADLDGSGDVSLGDVLTYDFVVTNTGNTTLTSVGVSDPMTTPPACGLTTLLPAQSTVCLATYAVQQSDIDAGAINNTAIATGTDPTGGMNSADDSESVIPAQNPSINSEKAFDVFADVDGDGRTSAGDTFEYEITISNDGDVTLTFIVANDSLTGDPGCPVTTLAPATSMMCSVVYTVTQADIDFGEVLNVVDVRAERPGGNLGDPSDDVVDTDDETVVIAPVPQVSIDKTLAGYTDADSTTDITPGDTLMYEFVVTNTGNTSLSNLLVSDPTVGSVDCGGVTTLIPSATATCTAAYVVVTADADAGEVVNVATVTGDDPNGTTVTDMDTVTTEVTRHPAIDIDKLDPTINDNDGSGDISVNDVLDFDLVVTNTGSVTLTGIVTTDPTAGPVDCGGVTSLVPGDSVTCTASYTVTQADVDLGEVRNTATVQGVGPSGAVVGDSDIVIVPIVQDPALTLTKSFDGFTDVDSSGRTDVGDTAAYSLTLENTGDVTITNIVVSDPTTAPVDCGGVTSLAPGASLVCTASYTLVQDDVDNGSIVNVATASGEDPVGDPVGAVDVVTTPVPQIATLETAKSLDALSITEYSAVGEVIEYDIAVTNTGTVTLTEVTVSDANADTLVCLPSNPADLGPTETITCDATHTVTQADLDAGSVVNTASANGLDPSLAVVSDDSAPVTIDAVQTGELTTTKTTTEVGYSAVGEVLDYVIEVTNTGNVTVTGATVSDANADTFVCLPSNPADLAPTETISCDATHTVIQADLDAGSVINTASASGLDPNLVVVSDDSAPVTVDGVQSAELTTTKTTTEVSYAAVGEVLDYVIEVTNTGNVTVTGVTVSDANADTLVCLPSNPADLGPTETVSCDATHTVTQADLDAGSVINTASASGLDPNLVVVSDDSAPVTIPAGQSAELTTTKTSTEVGYGAVGEVLDYVIEVANTGNVTITEVTVVDLNADTLVCLPSNPADLGPTETITCDATHIVTQADLDAGSVVNTASASGLDPNSVAVSDDSAPVTVDGVQAGELTTTKTTTEVSYSAVGEVLDYVIEVANTGNVTITEVTVSDANADTLVCLPSNPADLGPTETITCDATHTVTQADLDAGSVVNTASASGLDPNSVAVSDDSAPVTVDGVQAGELTTTKTTTEVSYSAVGEVLDYVIEVTNTGNVTLTGVTVSDANADTLVCLPSNPADLGPTETITCDATHTVTQADLDAGSVVNTASANGLDPSLAVVSDDSAPVTIDAVQTGELTTTKTTTEVGYSAVGEVLDYVIEVTNTGNVTVTGATVSDANADTFVCLPSNPADLAPTETISCDATHTVIQADLDAGSVINTASASGLDPNLVVVSDDSAPVTVDGVQSAELTTTKTTTEVSYAAVGEVLDYVIEVTNTGNVTVTGVTVSDANADTLVCLPSNPADLGPTETVSCDATHTVTQADLDAGSVINTASASGLDPNLVVVSDDSAPVTIPAGQSAELTTTKTSTEVGYGAVGEVLDYVIEVANTGNVTITEVTVVDLNADTLVCLPSNPADLGPTETITCDATHIVTQADLDAGSVVNTASASGLDPNSVAVSDDSAPVTVDGVQAGELTTTKTTTEVSYSAVGEVLDYVIEVANTGNVTITEVTVSDANADTLVCLPSNPADLGPTETITCDATHTVTQADLDAGSVVNTASASGLDPNSVAVSDDSAPVTVDGVQSAELTTTKTTTEVSYSAVGEVLDYVIEVTNTGNVTVTGVTVSDANADTLVCLPSNPADLGPTETVSCDATHTVTQADLDAGSVINTASASGLDPNLVVVSDDSAPVTIPAGQSAELTTTKTTTEVGYGAVGEVLDYVIEVTNTGNVTITEVTVSDANADTLVCLPSNPADLGPTETITCDATHIVTQADLDAGSVVNTASASGLDPNSVAVSDDSAPVTIDGVQAAELTTTKTTTEVSYSAVGEVLDYVIEVANTGNVTITEVTVSDANADTLVCLPSNPADLGPTETITCDATHTVTQADLDAGSVVNTASASGLDQNLVVVSDDSAPVTINAIQAAALTTTKIALDSSFLAAGDQIDYEITVTNSGIVTISGVVVSDANADAGSLICSPTTPVVLIPGASTSCTAVHTVTAADVIAESVLNVATATGSDPSGVPVSDDSSAVIVDIAPIRVLEVVKASPTASFDHHGDVIEYTFVIRNVGNVAVANVVLIDSNASEVECENTAIPAGGQIGCTARHVVTQADVDAGSVTNTATVRADGVGPVSSNTVIVPANQLASMTIAKATSATSFASVGQIIPFTFTVTNTGNVTLINVVVNDPNATTPSCPDTTLDPDESMVCSAIHVATTTDLLAGRFTNTATVSASSSVIGVSSATSNTVVVPRATETVVPRPNTPVVFRPNTPAVPRTNRPIPRTGADTGAIVEVAVLMSAAGWILLFAARCRRRSDRVVHL